MRANHPWWPVVKAPDDSSARSMLIKLHELFQSGDWSVLRGDGRMTLPYEEAEKIAEELEKLVSEFR